MKALLLSSIFVLLAGLTSIGQDKDNMIIKTIVKDGKNGATTVEIITAADSDIQGILDSIEAAHGDDVITINVIKVPGLGGNSPFNWMEFEGMEDFENILEMGDHMKWMSVDDLEELKELQRMEEDKPFLGVIFDTDEETDRGIRIMNIVEESAAEQAGLLKEDMLLNIGESEVNSLEELVEALSEHEIGDEVMILYSRNGKEDRTTATLKSRAESNYDLAKSFEFKMPECCAEGKECEFHSNKTYQAFVHKQKPKLGVHVVDLDNEMIEDLKVKSGKGILVTKVLDETAAKKMGLKINDVILSLNKKEISDVSTLHEILSGQKLGDEIEIDYLRYGQQKSAKGVLFEFNHHSAIDEMIFFKD